MKKLIPAIAILFVATTGILYFINIKPQRPAPVDTIIVDGEDEAHFEKKKEWFDAMHRTAPGDNWKAMDIEYRHERSNGFKKTGAISGTWSEVGSNNLAGRTHLADYDQETGEVYLLTSGGNIWKGTPGNMIGNLIMTIFRLPVRISFVALALKGENAGLSQQATGIFRASCIVMIRAFPGIILQGWKMLQIGGISVVL